MLSCFRAAVVVSAMLPILFALACGGGGGESGTPTAPTTATTASVSGPSLEGEPSPTEWLDLVAEIEAMANDSVVRALAEAEPAADGTSRPAARAFTARDLRIPLIGFSWSHSYWCCGSSGIGNRVSSDGRIELNVDASGSIGVTQTLRSAFALSWGPSSSAWSFQLPPDGLTITSVLRPGPQAGTFRPAQEFHVVGTITYWKPTASGLPGLDAKTARIDVNLGYHDFLARLVKPVATGDVGSSQNPTRLNGAPLPLSTLPRCPCPSGGRDNAPANPGCSIMCALR